MRAKVQTMHIIIVHLEVYSGRFEHVGKFLNFKNELPLENENTLEPNMIKGV